MSPLFPFWFRSDNEGGHAHVLHTPLALSICPVTSSDQWNDDDQSAASDGVVLAPYLPSLVTSRSGHHEGIVLSTRPPRRSKVRRLLRVCPPLGRRPFVYTRGVYTCKDPRVLSHGPLTSCPPSPLLTQGSQDGRKRRLIVLPRCSCSRGKNEMRQRDERGWSSPLHDSSEALLGTPAPSRFLSACTARASRGSRLDALCEFRKRSRWNSGFCVGQSGAERLLP